MSITLNIDAEGTVVEAVGNVKAAELAEQDIHKQGRANNKSSQTLCIIQTGGQPKIRK